MGHRVGLPGRHPPAYGAGGTCPAKAHGSLVASPVERCAEVFQVGHYPVRPPAQQQFPVRKAAVGELCTIARR